MTYTPEQILELPMVGNDANAKTVRDYLKKLLARVWDNPEGFSGKRPFGNSSWEYELYHTLVVGKAVPGSIEQLEGGMEIECDDFKLADRLIAQAIGAL